MIYWKNPFGNFRQIDIIFFHETAASPLIMQVWNPGLERWQEVDVFAPPPKSPGIGQVRDCRELDNVAYWIKPGDLIRYKSQFPDYPIFVSRMHFTKNELRITVYIHTEAFRKDKPEVEVMTKITGEGAAIDQVIRERGMDDN